MNFGWIALVLLLPVLNVGLTAFAASKLDSGPLADDWWFNAALAVNGMMAVGGILSLAVWLSEHVKWTP